MGSSIFSIRHRGRTYHQSTPFDGHTQSILAQVASSLAAAGVESLKSQLDLLSEGQKEIQDAPTHPDDTLFLADRASMGKAYSQACRARGHAPIWLDLAMTYEYGNPDFAHGGIIALFAPIAYLNEGKRWRIENADVILDLDQGVLVVPHRDPGFPTLEGAYDNGIMGADWSIPLADFDELDPIRLNQHLIEASLDGNKSGPARKSTITRLLKRSRIDSETVVEPPSTRFMGSSASEIRDSELEPPRATRIRRPGA